jgi:dihydroflavonol-4-reductase
MIYITGATGHIGNNLARQLDKENIPFKILARRINEAIIPYKDRVIIGDIFNMDFLAANLQEKDTLVHLAAYINLKNNQSSLTEEINYHGVVKIVDFCIKNDIYLVFSSSVDCLKGDEYCLREPENISLNQENLYQRTKTQATEYLIEKMHANLIDAFIVYPSAVIGINDYKPSAVGKEIRNCFKRRIWFYFSGGYNFVDVEDVVIAITNGLKSRIKGQFIIGGNYVDLKTMYQLIFKNLNRRVLLIKIPNFIIKLISKIIPKFKVMIEALLFKHNFSNKKMKTILNVQPKPVEETIKNTVEWFRANKKKS